MKRTLPRLLALLLLGYAGLCGWLYAAQDTMLYFPTAPAEARDADALLFEHDGESLRVWQVGAGSRALLYFGGNAENVAWTASEFSGLLADTAVYLPEYRGYGASSGEPGEAAFYRDAAFLYDRVAGQHADIALVGRSLGSGVAAWLAAERPVTRLVLVTPFDSLEAVAQGAYPFVPVSMLLRDKYPSIERVPDIAARTLVLVADEDRVIDYGRTMALVSRFPPDQVRVMTVAHTNHNTISRSPAYREALRDFLAGAPADTVVTRSGSRTSAVPPLPRR